VLFGCALASKVPGHKLRSVIAMIAILLGLQLVWTGTRSLVHERTRIAANASAYLKADTATQHRP